MLRFKRKPLKIVIKLQKNVLITSIENKFDSRDCNDMKQIKITEHLNELDLCRKSSCTGVIFQRVFREGKI